MGLFRNGDHEIIVAMMGSKKKWADLRPLIEKGFELEGAPIAKLPPAEEKLFFAKRGNGKAARVTRRSSRKRRCKVVTGSTASTPAKKKAALKRKPKSRDQES